MEMACFPPAQASWKAKKHLVAKALAVWYANALAQAAAEGTTYEEVEDQLRQSLALQYLKEPGMTLSQIALLLG
jgi:hypothetical protein